jgi:redox-sensitive bicupin YhaK (pirin superfamily)
MPVHFSPVIAAKPRALPGFSSLQYLDLEALEVAAAPLAVLDDFRVTGMPFSPHPHAGFAAVTYVLEDSPGDLRSRASSGADLTVGPGGIVWTHAGHGVVHEEVPAVAGRELHGLQLFVNLSSKYKLTAPQVLHLEPAEVPQWHSDDGDRVRVVVGSFNGISSPLVPPEPFTLLDVRLLHQIAFDLQAGHSTIVYVLTGNIVARADGHEKDVDGGHALAFGGDGERVTLEARSLSHFLILSGNEIGEPVVAEGPFIMNERSQIADAFARYRSGAMGRLAPA